MTHCIVLLSYMYLLSNEMHDHRIWAHSNFSIVKFLNMKININDNEVESMFCSLTVIAYLIFSYIFF